MQDLADAALIKAQSTFANNEDPLQLNQESSHESSEDEDGDDDEEQQLRIEYVSYARHYNPLLIINRGFFAKKLKSFLI